MVTITNGNRTMTVSKGAFEALFEPIGWKEVEDENFLGLTGKKSLNGIYLKTIKTRQRTQISQEKTQKTLMKKTKKNLKTTKLKFLSRK